MCVFLYTLVVFVLLHVILLYCTHVVVVVVVVHTPDFVLFIGMAFSGEMSNQKDRSKYTDGDDDDDDEYILYYLGKQRGVPAHTYTHTQTLARTYI